MKKVILSFVCIVFWLQPPASSAGEISRAGEEIFARARNLLHGLDSPKDITKAFGLMKEAAALGHPDAVGGVGYFYATGQVVGRDDAEAAIWFRKGAELGSSKSQLNFAKVLLEGKGVEKNITEGLKWAKASADQKLGDAALFYGNILYHGDHGREVNYPEAFKWLLVAAEQGDKTAQNMIGTMLLHGQGVEMDEPEAVRWLKKSALQGYARAQSNLGHHIGPEANDVTTRIKSWAWLLLAEEQEDAAAKGWMQTLNAYASTKEMSQAKEAAAELRNQIQTAN